MDSGPYGAPWWFTRVRIPHFALLSADKRISPQNPCEFISFPPLTLPAYRSSGMCLPTERFAQILLWSPQIAIPGIRPIFRSVLTIQSTPRNATVNWPPLGTTLRGTKAFNSRKQYTWSDMPPELAATWWLDALMGSVLNNLKWAQKDGFCFRRTNKSGLKLLRPNLTFRLTTSACGFANRQTSSRSRMLQSWNLIYIEPLACHTFLSVTRGKYNEEIVEHQKPPWSPDRPRSGQKHWRIKSLRSTISQTFIEKCMSDTLRI